MRQAYRAGCLQWIVVLCMVHIATSAKIGILTDTSSEWFSVDQVTAAGLMACRHVQERIAYLVPQAAELGANFTLECEFADTKSSEALGIEKTLQFVENGVDVIVGAHYSKMSSPVALIAALTKTPVISYWSTAPGLSDKNVYPYFGRTIPHDLFTSHAVASAVASFGWKAIAVLHSDGEFGQGFSQGIAAGVGSFGLELLTSQRFFSGSLASLETALRNIAESGARVIVGLLFIDEDLTAPFLQLVAELGLAGRGYVWILPDSLNPSDILQQSLDPARDAELISGWIQITTAPFAEGRGERFQSAWRQEEVESLAPAGLFQRSELAALTAQDCHVVCGYMWRCEQARAGRASVGATVCALRESVIDCARRMGRGLSQVEVRRLLTAADRYDAIWAAAFAVATTPRRSDGSYRDKGEVVEAMRALHLVGATGVISFDSHLDRSEEGMAVQVLNWYPVRQEDGEVEVRSQRIALWHQHSNLTRDLNAVPYWPGGAEGWDKLPQDGWSCEAGQVYSEEELACVACPPGSIQVEKGCEACPRGYFAALSGTTQCLPCAAQGFANQSGQTACHPCPSNHQVPPAVLAAVSSEECVCKDGLLFSCSWHTWQLVLLVALVVVVALAGWAVANSALCRPSSLDLESQRVQARVALIRDVLSVRREDGFLLPGESQTLWRRLRCVRTRAMLKAKYVENLARLSLMMSFEVEAVDSLAMQLHILEDVDDLAAKGMHSLLRLELGVEYSQSAKYQSLCRLLIHISRQLLDPDAAARAKEPPAPLNPRPASWPALRSTPGATADDVRVPHASAEQRFDFFREKVAKLQVWEQGENFSALKREVQGLMDDLRLAMDALYLTIKDEDGGQQLVGLDWPMEREGWQAQRQDHASVKAIRVDEESAVEMSLQRQHSASPPSSRHAFSPSSPGVKASRLRPPRPWSSELKSERRVSESVNPSHELALPTALPAASLEAEPQPPGEEGSCGAGRLSPLSALPPVAREQLGRRSPWSAATEPPPLPPFLGGDESCVQLEVGEGKQARGGGTPVRGTRRQASSISVEGGAGNPWRGDGGQVRGSEEPSGINEEGFVHQLWLRAGLLNRGFQCKVHTVFAERLGGGESAQQCPEERPQRWDGAEEPRGAAARHGEGSRLGVVSADVKSKTRMQDKVRRYAEQLLAEGGCLEPHLPLTAYILDPVRASIICPDPKSIVELASWLMEHGERCGLPVVRVKNKFAVTDSSEYDGYRDLMLCVMYSGDGGLRIIGELQLHDARMYPLKVKMHRLYKVKRATSASVI